ncbi:HNH endonuclease [Halorussus halophilus]|uniref:HNH endonuclease n=1 Tax=Halorussus halophilus TaxID=2650975 RepID=UPI0013015536|nr:HNH endonuclease [Halorussus halophilus]
MQDSIDILFYRLLFGDRKDLKEIDDRDKEHAIKKAIDVVGSEAQLNKKEIYEFRLRLAMHLCPAEAIDYKKTNPLPRHEIIRDYLTNELGYDRNIVDRLSRDLHNILDSWDAQRGTVAHQKDTLLTDQEYRCANCHISFRGTKFTGDCIRELGPDKPIPHIDHIEPVSSFGTNDPDNLQILCSFCNRGKGRGLGVDVKKEMKYAASNITDIPEKHRMEVYYYVINSNDSECAICGGKDCFLTIRKVQDGGGFARSNLEAICLDCI